MLAKVRLVGVLAALAACDRSAESSPGADARAATADSVVLERMACFGTCPIYRLSVAGSGRVAFVSPLAPALVPLRAYENAIDSITRSARWVRSRGSERARPIDR